MNEYVTHPFASLKKCLIFAQLLLKYPAALPQRACFFANNLYRPEMKISLCAILLAVLSVIVSSEVSAQQTSGSFPRLIGYQAALHNADGTVPDGRTSVTVRLYRDESGSRALWSDTFDATIERGILDLQLGSQ